MERVNAISRVNATPAQVGRVEEHWIDDQPPAGVIGRDLVADLMLALEQDDGQKLGGKSAEAARFILRAMSRELDNA